MYIHIPLNKAIYHKELPQLIGGVLPEKYSYIFETFQPITTSTEVAFSATLNVNLTTLEEAMKWISALESHTSSTFRMTRGNRTTGARIIYKTDRHCQHKQKKPHSNYKWPETTQFDT